LYHRAPVGNQIVAEKAHENCTAGAERMVVVVGDKTSNIPYPRGQGLRRDRRWMVMGQCGRKYDFVGSPKRDLCEFGLVTSPPSDSTTWLEIRSWTLTRHRVS